MPVKKKKESVFLGKFFFVENYKIIFAILIGALTMLLFFVFQIGYVGRILPGVKIGTLDVSRLTQEQAQAKLAGYLKDYHKLSVVNGNQTENIVLSDIDFQVNVRDSVERAWLIGRQGSWFDRSVEKIIIPFRQTIVFPVLSYNQGLLDDQIRTLSLLWDSPRRDIRYEIKEGKVGILTDVQAGKIIDKDALRLGLMRSLILLSSNNLTVTLIDDLPRVDIKNIPQAKAKAEMLISSDLKLTYKNYHYQISPERIGDWIISAYQDDKLVPDLDKQKISNYVSDIAVDINTAAQDISIEVKDGKVVNFISPRSGLVLEEDETVRLITTALLARGSGTEIIKEISLPVSVKKPVQNQTAADLGINELIGEATTTFTGSPSNRVANIKNGTKSLTGILIAPDEEFSTVKTLGTIDNTTGYLPELVIKGDETIPEFGGGLCQVSTTLFRAVLNAGLPVTARRNHSYRVSYYEKDGQGNYIGPGLDATIYDPNPDFRFLNDTGNYILIIGRVEGDSVTFELYGTADGRQAEVDGPYTLSTIPPGDPIYIETDELPPGEKKRLDRAHPGGAAIAYYQVVYPDGRVEKTEFKSNYRRWPAKYLIGIESSTEEETVATSTEPIDS